MRPRPDAGRCLAGVDDAGNLPKIGELLAEAEAGFDGASYDDAWAARAQKTMW